MITARAHIPTLCPPAAIAVELGVAAGKFSAEILRCSKIAKLFSIDRWSDHHDQAEEQSARRLLSEFGDRSVVLRSTFAEALPAFADDSLDLIYIDGYAHTGQEGGVTLRAWWPKLKRGGIFAGHDYAPEWQPTIDAVDAFAAELGLVINVTQKGEGADKYPSWWVVKP